MMKQKKTLNRKDLSHILLFFGFFTLSLTILNIIRPLNSLQQILNDNFQEFEIELKDNNICQQKEEQYFVFGIDKIGNTKTLTICCSIRHTGWGSARINECQINH